jgi:uncharacterized protein
MDKKSESLLIIFYRNPELGKVKTRLAATMGQERALAIFRRLSQHTRQVTENLLCDTMVFYSDFIDQMDLWQNYRFLKRLQQGEDLGKRMRNAFISAFTSGYHSVCLIGTDCYELTDDVIQMAFEGLKSVDAVIGPARDGGYYLIGMNRPFKDVFESKRWSTDEVFRETVADIQSLGLTYLCLPILSDIDTEDDLPGELR